MLASQLIYTSWKNGDSPKKGFMVYSKTNDISEEDSRLIMAVMQYKPLPDLPYTPTDQEIDEKFPRNVAYFELPSGKYCLAQACYVGQDYSSRWGNYIIHAFVIDEPNDLLPVTYIGSEIFRRRLTEEELNLNETPAPLPKVELANYDKALTEKEVNEFFNEERKQQLKLIAQSVVDAKNSGSKVYLRDEWANMKYWLKALALILPKELIKSLTFGTYIFETIECLDFICIRQMPTFNNYSYDETNTVSYTFDLLANNNSITELTNRYIDEACDRLVSDYFGCITYTSDISNTCKKYSINDYSKASLLFAMEKNNLKKFQSFDEMKEIYEIVANSNSNNQSQLASNVYVEVIKLISTKNNFDDQKKYFDFLKKLYVNLDSTKKEEILRTYLLTLTNNVANSNPQSAYEKLKDNWPVSFSTTLNVVLKQENIDELLRNNTDNSEYFVAIMMLDAYQSVNDMLKNTITNNLLAIYEKLARNKNYNYLKEIIKKASNISERYKDEMLAKYASKNVNVFVGDFSSTFEYLIATEDKRYFWHTISEMLKIHPEITNNLVKFYYEYKKNNKQLLTEYETVVNDSTLKKFLTQVELKGMEEKTNYSIDELSTIYKKSIELKNISQELALRYRQIFIKKITEDLQKLDNKERIREALLIHKNIYLSVSITENDKELVTIISDAIFKNTTFEDFRASKVTRNEMESIERSMNSVGIRIPDCVELFYYAQENFTNMEVMITSRKVTKILEDMGLDVTSKPKPYKLRVEIEKEKKELAKKEAKELKEKKKLEKEAAKKGLEAKTETFKPEEVVVDKKVEEEKPTPEVVVNVDDSKKPEYLQKNITDTLRGDFFNCYGSEIIRYDLSVANNRITEHLVSKVLVYLLEPLSSYRYFNDMFQKALLCDFDKTNEYLVGIYNYIFANKNQFSKLLSEITDKYFEELDKKKANKCFEYLINNVIEYEKMEEIMNNYNKDHQNFIDKIKGIFKKQK